MGSLILGRKEDGRLEVLRADDEIEIDEEIVNDLPREGDYRRDGQVIKVDASNGRLAYILTDLDMRTHLWRAIRTKGQDAAR